MFKLTKNKTQILEIIQDYMNKQLDRNCIIYTDVDKKSECWYVALSNKNTYTWETTWISENNYKWFGEFVEWNNSKSLTGRVTLDHGKTFLGEGRIIGQYDLCAVINFLKNNWVHVDVEDGCFHIEELVWTIENPQIPMIPLWLYSDKDDVNLLKILNYINNN